MRSISTIARNTLIEALRQKVLNVLFIAGIVILCGANFFTQFSFQEEFKFLKDLAYAAISITGLLVALMGAAQLIPAEIERRTLYTTLSKPVYRFEFILGKYLGLVALLTIMVLVMSVLFGLVLHWKETQKIGEIMGAAGGAHLDEYQSQMVANIRHEARDAGMVLAVVLVWAKLCVIAAISVFFSTIATSTIFIVSTTLLVYFTGHLQSVARDVWLHGGASPEFWKTGILALVSWLVPDFQAYNLIDEIIAGNSVAWGPAANIMAYSLVYVLVVLGVSALVFEEREL